MCGKACLYVSLGKNIMHDFRNKTSVPLHQELMQIAKQVALESTR